VEVPEGELVVRLYEGAVGPTRLAQAQARAALDARQRLTFSADLVPAEAGRHAGHVHVAGGLPLRPAPPGAHTPGFSLRSPAALSERHAARARCLATRTQ
jgi:hypothetical protein